MSISNFSIVILTNYNDFITKRMHCIDNFYQDLKQHKQYKYIFITLNKKNHNITVSFDYSNKGNNTKCAGMHVKFKCECWKIKEEKV